MKKWVVTLVFVIVLVGCSQDVEEIGKVGDDTYTNKDFIEALVEGLDEETLQLLYVRSVLGEYSDKETEEEIYEDYIRDFENASEEKLDEATKQEFKEMAKQDAGTVKVLKDLEYVTDKDIDEKYKDNQHAYGINVVIIAGDEIDAEKVKGILQDSGDAEQEVNSLGDNVEYFGDVIYTDFTSPEGFPMLKGNEEGDIIVEKDEEEGITYVIEMVVKEEVKREEVEYEIILSMGNEVVGTVDEFILDLEDEGFITMDKDLREYLGIDRNRAE